MIITPTEKNNDEDGDDDGGGGDGGGGGKGSGGNGGCNGGGGDDGSNDNMIQELFMVSHAVRKTLNPIWAYSWFDVSFFVNRNINHSTLKWTFSSSLHGCYGNCTVAPYWLPRNTVTNE